MFSQAFKSRRVGGEKFRYFQIRITTFVSPNYCVLSEIEWSPDGGVTRYPYAINNAHMTADNVPSPLVVTVPATHFGAPFHIYNGDASGGDYWQHTNNGAETFHRIDLGAGNEIDPDWIRIVWYTGAFYGVNYQFEGSNTGAFTGEETVLHSVTGNGVLSDIYDTLNGG